MRHVFVSRRIFRVFLDGTQHVCIILGVCWFQRCSDRLDVGCSSGSGLVTASFDETLGHPLWKNMAQCHIARCSSEVCWSCFCVVSRMGNTNYSSCNWHHVSRYVQPALHLYAPDRAERGGCKRKQSLSFVSFLS